MEKELSHSRSLCERLQPHAQGFSNVTIPHYPSQRIGTLHWELNYWKLYAIENLIRVTIHSVLSAQIRSDWWIYAVDPDFQKEIEKRKRNYRKKPWHTSPGSHELYYVYLSGLNSIILGNINLFRPLIPDIDNWLVILEELRVPRNVIGHMNWLNASDKSKIDKTYREVKVLVRDLSDKLSRIGKSITIP